MTARSAAAAGPKPILIEGDREGTGASGPSAIMIHLRRCGVVVHHAARMPSPADRGYEAFVVFLEASLHQQELASVRASR